MSVGFTGQTETRGSRREPGAGWQHCTSPPFYFLLPFFNTGRSETDQSSYIRWIWAWDGRESRIWPTLAAVGIRRTQTSCARLFFPIYAEASVVRGRIHTRHWGCWLHGRRGEHLQEGREEETTQGTGAEWGGRREIFLPSSHGSWWLQLYSGISQTEQAERSDVKALTGVLISFMYVIKYLYLFNAAQWF